MLPILDLQTLLLVLVVLLVTYAYVTRPKNLPPGPWAWPIIGNLPTLAKGNVHLILTKWKDTYGDIVFFKLGMKSVVCLNTYDVIKDALGRKADVFSSRPTNLPVTNAVTKNKGIICAPFGAFWKTQRKFAIKSLRDFGFGKRSVEGKILEEFAPMQSAILQMNGSPFDIRIVLQQAVTNVICSMVFGHRWEYTDPDFKGLMHALDELATQTFVPENFISILPWSSKARRKFIGTTAKVAKHIEAQIEKHRETFDPNDIRDFIDAFLLEMENQRNNTNDSTFSDEQLVQTVRDLFAAGSETTATTLYWGLLLMVLKPNVQEKVQKEIDHVLGQNVPPSMSHRADMPYTEATLAEISRFASIVPLAVYHAVSSDAELNGYTIPKDTIVLPNLWAVHHDAQFFPEPNTFDPTRFLDANGSLKKDDHLIPFSIGPRVCMGEQLGKAELFLLFTSLLQHLTFKLPEGAPTPSLKGVQGFTLAPEEFELVAIARD